MNSRETGRKQIRTHRVALGKKRQTKPSAGKPSNPSLDALSEDALIEALRGSYKGKTSLVAARERDHKRDEHAKSRKLAAIGR